MTSSSQYSASAEDDPSSSSFSLSPEVDRYRAFVEASAELLIELTEAGEIRYISEHVLTLLGLPAVELLGTSLATRIHPDERRTLETIFSQSGRSVSVRVRHEDNSFHWWEISCRQNHECGGETRRLLTARDVTAQKELVQENQRLQTAVARANHLDLLGSLATSVAHDFNNILGVVMSYTDLTRVAMGGRSEAQEYLAQIAIACSRGRQIIRQVFTVSRREHQVRSATKLQPIVQEVLKLLLPSLPRSIHVSTELDPAVGSVSGDPAQLHQAVMNLCTNAVHAMRVSGGQLTVHVRARPIGENEPNGPALRPGNYLHLSISDTGYGMDQNTQQRIFEPFFTTKPPGEGTGLGLAVVQAIVKDHNGLVLVSSRPGAGSTFHVFLPLLES